MAPSYSKPMGKQSNGVGRAGHGSEFYWWKAVKHGRRITAVDLQNTAQRLGFDGSIFVDNAEEKNIIQKYKGCIESSANVEEFKKKWRAILIAQSVPRRFPYGGVPPAPSPPAPSPATMRQKLEQKQPPAPSPAMMRQKLEQKLEQELELAEREQFVRMEEREVKSKLAELEDLLDKAKMAAPKIVLGTKEGAENCIANMVDVQPDIPFMIREERNPAVLKLEASDPPSPNHNPSVVDAEPASAPPVADCNCGCRCVIA